MSFESNKMQQKQAQIQQQIKPTSSMDQRIPQQQQQQAR